MNTKDFASNLRLMADTIEELEIDQIISCETDNRNQMLCHLYKLTITGVEATWTARSCDTYPWEKSFTYNNIKFFTVYTVEEYLEETSA